MQHNARRDADRLLHNGGIFPKSKRHAYMKEKLGMKTSNPFRSSSIAGTAVDAIKELPRTKTGFTGATAKSRAAWNDKLDERRALDSLASHGQLSSPAVREEDCMDIAREDSQGEQDMDISPTLPPANSASLPSILSLSETVHACSRSELLMKAFEQGLSTAASTPADRLHPDCDKEVRRKVEEEGYKYFPRNEE